MSINATSVASASAPTTMEEWTRLLQDAAAEVRSQSASATAAAGSDALPAARTQLAAAVSTARTVAARLQQLAHAHAAVPAAIEPGYESRLPPGVRPNVVRQPPSSLPDVSTAHCRMFSDGFEFCEYENVCVDVAEPSDKGPGGVLHNTDLLFIKSDSLPASLRDAREYVRAHPEDARAAAELARLAPYPDRDWYLPSSLASHGVAEPTKFDAVFEDIQSPDIMDSKRCVPFGTRSMPRTIPASDAVPRALGGTAPGHVIWLEDVYVANNVLSNHLWGFASTVGAPLLSVHALNYSMGLALPPVKTLLVLNSDVAQLLTPEAFMKSTEGTTSWAAGMLSETLTHLAGGVPPYVGKLMSADMLPNASAAHYPAAAAVASRGGGLPKDASAGGAEYLTLRNPRSGTRIVYNTLDLPLPPLSPGDGASLSSVRVCMKKGVMLGEKPTFVGGVAEGNTWRRMGHNQLEQPRYRAFWELFPPHKILIFNRKSWDADYGRRTFQNLDDMARVARKYGVTVDVLDDSDLKGKTFREQVTLLGSYGIYIVAHGAMETNLLFAPRRAAVIEVYPYGMWCPLYTRMATALGHAIFPIYSHQLGTGVTMRYVTGKAGAESDKLAEECHKKTLLQAADSDCWHEFKNAAIVTPLPELERALVDALDLIGLKLAPRQSPVDLLHGVPQEGDWLFRYEPGAYENRTWHLCSRCSDCPALPAPTLADNMGTGNG